MRPLIGRNRPDTFVTLVRKAFVGVALTILHAVRNAQTLRSTRSASAACAVLLLLAMSAKALAMSDEIPAEIPAKTAAESASEKVSETPEAPESSAGASGSKTFSGASAAKGEPTGGSDKSADAADAEGPNAEGANAAADQPASVMGIKTLGGRQFWGDVQFFRGWRIQKNVLTGHYRLLDPEDRRYSWGKRQDCERQLQKFRQELELPPMSGDAVLLLHGIGRSSHSFSGMAKALRQDGLLVVPFDYPSTRLTIQDSAEYLHQVIQSLEGVQRIHVVAHSMGGLLLRAYVMKYQEPRFGRAVMLGVPNRGAEIADVLKNNPLFKAILGPAGQQLVTSEDCVVQTLPVPEFPFGVIAGGRSQPKGFNPLLPGDNDLTVTVASTRLPGAADFRIVPVMHSFLMNDKTVIRFTRNFLQHGCFDPAETPDPITAEAVKVLE